MRRKWLLACLLLLGWGCQKDKMETTSVPTFLAWGFSIEGFPVTKQDLEKVEQETKLAAQIIQFYLQWPQSAEHFESILPSLEAIVSVGAIPCITWEPMFIMDQKEKTISYERILDGHYDGYLNEIANEIKQWNKPIIIRFAHEMNLKRYHWGTSEEEYGAKSPEIYIKLFRYVATFFKNQNVKNVRWVFCPNVDSIPNEAWNQARNYYPGDAYVDILGMDGYNWAITSNIASERQLSWTKPWMSFEQIFQGLYSELKQISPHKPIMVFETASVNREDRKKSMWLKDALEVAKRWKLMGMIWFQSNKEENWLIQQDGDYSYVPVVRTAIFPFSENIDLY